MQKVSCKKGNQIFWSVANEFWVMSRSTAARSASQWDPSIKTPTYKDLEQELPIEKKQN